MFREDLKNPQFDILIGKFIGGVLMVIFMIYLSVIIILHLIER